MKSSIGLNLIFSSTNNNHLMFSFASSSKTNTRHKENNRNLNLKSENQNVFNFKHFFIGLLILVIVCSFFINTSEQSTYITNKGYYGSTSKTNIENFIRYIVNNEISLAEEQINKGKVFKIQSGKEVILVKSDFSMVKIRFKNNSQEFWTVLETIKN